MPTPTAQADALKVARNIPSVYNRPLRAVVVAPKAVLHREAFEDEEAVLGSYNPDLDVTYDIPDRTAEDVLDTSSVKILIRDAELLLFKDVVGSGNTVAPVSGYKNRLDSSGTNFKTNGTTYPRDSSLYNRDIQPGDIVVYGAVISSVYTVFKSTVRSLIATKAAASIASATANTGNKTTQSASATFSQPSGALNWVTGTGDATSYNDLNGGVTRTYTILVTTGGPAASAVLQVISSDGLDNVAAVTPAAFSSPTTIGTKGLTVTFALDNGRPVDAGVTNNQFVTGQKFQVVTAEAFTAPTATSTGTYSGTQNLNYIIQVTRGGHYADLVQPQITITSDLGVDSSGPTTVTSAGVDFAVGSFGVTVRFNQTGLCKGDIYYIAATAAADAQIRTIELTDNLPTGFLALTDGDLELRLGVSKLELRSQRQDETPAYNWQLVDPSITLYSGATATDPAGSLVDNSNVIRYVKLRAGSAVMEYREWDVGAANRLQLFQNIDDAVSELVSLDTDNPAGYVIGQMLLNSDGFPVGLMGVRDPSDPTSWGDAFDALKAAENCYHICVASGDPGVVALLKAHLDDQNSSTNENFRVGITALDIPSTSNIVDATNTSDLGVCLAILADNPDTVGTQYNYVTSTNGKFITNGVKAGDKFRTAFTVDAYGNETYSEFTVSSVVNENTLVLVTSSAIPYPVAQRSEIVRNLTAQDQVDYVIAKVGTLKSQYLRTIFPDSVVDINGNAVPSYYFGACLGATLAAVAPHQPYNYYTISGFNQVVRAGFFYTPGQLKILQDAGVIVLDDDGNGTSFVRRCVTTDPTSIDTYEEARVRSNHALVFAMREKLRNYRGQANAVDDVITTMTVDAQSAVKAIAKETKISGLGSLLDSDAKAEARKHVTLPDRAVVTITGNRPYPLNDFTTTFLVPVTPTV